MRFSKKQLLFSLQILLVWLNAGNGQSQKIHRKIFADVTSNKLTREHDGSFGMWSLHGIAKESHAKNHEFIFNADLVEEGNHKHIASALYPTLGLTSDLDPVYQEYLMLQAQLIGIDGFLVEWGYKGHPSDVALQSYQSLARKHQPFTLGVNWCDHWLYETINNQSRTVILKTFHDNLQYLMDTLFQAGPSFSVFHKKNPVIYLFGGGITSDILRELLSMPLDLKEGIDKPIWIGNYLNFASDKKWEEWADLLNGTFGWVPPRNTPTPPDMSEWDYYASLEDVNQYQKSINKFGSKCLKKKECIMWVGSASPQFDNRGCAGWGGELKKMAQWANDTSTGLSIDVFDAQWRYYINHATTTETILIPTLNDFSEASVILATNETGLQSLFSVLFFARDWKQKCYYGNDALLLFGFLDWYRIYKEAQFLGRIPNLNATEIIQILKETGQLISQQNMDKAKNSLGKARKSLNQLRSSVTTKVLNFQVPSEHLYTVVPPVQDPNGNYIINSTNGLFVQMEQSTADEVSKNNFKGFMAFQYKLLDSNFSHLFAMSSTNRTNSLTSVVPQETVDGSRLYGKFTSKFAEICDIMCNIPEIWQTANVTLYKQNQSWDHSAKYSSDIYFTADANFLIRNVSLRLDIWKKK
ncbi:uncharacterized protein LOC117113287 [Anneissia japonica]|uniref:uncharacterized protein LOC117113287 n=1 Tax=Anneissia japonica TaxID=1529436 RepID=UPI0014255933|nr:uncharacterized protein LOC117113287 [Anneissia japonica]